MLELSTWSHSISRSTEPIRFNLILYGTMKLKVANVPPRCSITHPQTLKLRAPVVGLKGHGTAWIAAKVQSQSLLIGVKWIGATIYSEATIRAPDLK